jgi:hypothetical protein
MLPFTFELVRKRETSNPEQCAQLHSNLRTE